MHDVNHITGYDDLTPEPARRGHEPLADAEVISVELDAPAKNVQPCAGLEESLDQIERLAAELADLTAPPPEETASPPAVPEPAPTSETADGNQDAISDLTSVVPPRPSPRRPRPMFTSCGPQNDAQALHENVSSHTQRFDEVTQTVPALRTVSCETPLDEPRRKILPSARPLWGPNISDKKPCTNSGTRPAEKPTVRVEAEPLRSRREAPTATRVMPSVDAKEPSSKSLDRTPKDPPQHRKARRWVFALVAATLAIPAFALGAVQPWLDEGDGDDSVALGARERTTNSVDSEPPSPEGAVPNEYAAQGDTGSRRSSPSTSQRQDATSPSTSLRRGTPSALKVHVSGDNVSPQVGKPVAFTIKWSDGSGNFAGLTSSWDDGSPGGSSQGSGCVGGQDGQDVSDTQNLSHTYSKPGTYTADFTVTTQTCDGQTERQTVPLTIHVQPPDETPTPTGSPTNSPSDTPSPSETR